MFYWFHENDTPEERRTLQVHPRRDPANPFTGVFACRAPVRPNLIGFTACRIVKVKGNVVEVADLDARDGTPILDLKPYIPNGDAIPEARTPEWLKRSPAAGRLAFRPAPGQARRLCHPSIANQYHMAFSGKSSWIRSGIIIPPKVILPVADGYGCPNQHIVAFL